MAYDMAMLLLKPQPLLFVKYIDFERLALHFSFSFPRFHSQHMQEMYVYLSRFFRFNHFTLMIVYFYAASFLMRGPRAWTLESKKKKRRAKSI